MTTPIRRSRAATMLLGMGLLVGACTSTATPPPPPSPSPSFGQPSPSFVPGPTTISSADAAAATVLASDPRFTGLTAQDPNLIGQCCFYVVAPAGDGFAVKIEIGWGDCPAGCINRHHWSYTVGADGKVRLDQEDGPPVPPGVPAPGGGTTGGIIGIRGTATAGPVCPVVRPGDASCADRPVVGALVHVLDATGTEVATLETDAAGAFVVGLPPGRYRVVADPVEGLMRTAPAVDVTVGSGLEVIELMYDTGIR